MPLRGQGVGWAGAARAGQRSAAVQCSNVLRAFHATGADPLAGDWRGVKTPARLQGRLLQEGPAIDPLAAGHCA
eukprot:1796601-Alexandrium_andersonii.AAC.1